MNATLNRETISQIMVSEPAVTSINPNHMATNELSIKNRLWETMNIRTSKKIRAKAPSGVSKRIS
jgi:hypothetical protein